MRQRVVTVGEATSVREATTLMRERGIRYLPVLDARQRLIGIVTDRDLRQVVLDVATERVAAADAGRLGDLPVREVMTWGVVTVTPATDLRQAARVMREQRLGALPVVDAAMHVVGIITERDLITALEAALWERTMRPIPLAGAADGTYEPDTLLPADDSSASAPD